MEDIPIYLGGYLIGLLLLINLMTSHATKFKLSKSYSGIFLIHFGLILLIIGSGLTSFFGEEMQISIQEGEEKNYVEYPSQFEFVIIDPSHRDFDHIFTYDFSDLDEGFLFNGFLFKSNSFAPNSIINQRGIENLKYNQLGKSFKLISMPKTFKMTERNIPGVTIEVSNNERQDFYLLWGGSAIYQDILLNGTSYLIKVRPKRRYLDFSIKLHDFTRIAYQKTETAKRFISDVSLITKTGQVPFKIQMNETFDMLGTLFQSSFTDDEKTSVFQVVKNPLG